MNADGTDPRFITAGDSGSSQPRWSSEGKEIFYVTKHVYNELSTEVYVMNIDGSNKQPVDSSHQGSNLPRPSPTRKEILLAWKDQVPYESGGYLLEYDSTSFPAGVGSFKHIINGFINECEWSPDGNLVAQKRDLSAGIEDLYLFNRDGSNNRRLTYGLRVSWFSWSRDSRYIVLRSHATVEENFGFFIVDIERETYKKLTVIR
jgi:Tol biopolymer transport system component